MPLVIEPMQFDTPLTGRALFLSASIPSPERWVGHFDSLEITDAVSAATRAILTAGSTVVSAVHPTIAPLLLYIAAEFPPFTRSRIVVYQSRLFENDLPEATIRFFRSGTGVLRWTEAALGEQPSYGYWDNSLRIMRETMLKETNPVAAIFIGGMQGITTELDTFQTLYPQRRWYAIGRPGGEARGLGEERRPPLWDALRVGDAYPAMFGLVIEDLIRSLH